MLGDFGAVPYRAAPGFGIRQVQAVAEPALRPWSSGDFYVLNNATSEMVGLYVGNAGTVTALPGSPYTMSAAPIAITVAPNNAFLYVSTVGGIFAYTVNTSSGLLTLRKFRPANFL